VIFKRNLLKFISAAFFLLFLSLSCTKIYKAIRDKYPPYEKIGRDGKYSLIRFNFRQQSATKVALAAWHIVNRLNKKKQKDMGIHVYLIKTLGRCIALKRKPDSDLWQVTIPLEPGFYHFYYVINDNKSVRDARIKHRVPDCGGPGGKVSVVIVK